MIFLPLCWDFSVNYEVGVMFYSEELGDMERGGRGTWADVEWASSGQTCLNALETEVCTESCAATVLETSFIISLCPSFLL